jgi:hypothetical protein
VSPDKDEKRKPKPSERILGYSVTKAAPSYSNVTGLLSGFALTAVVLSITMAGPGDLSSTEQIDVGFASAMFVVAFLGCLLCAYSMGSLAGEKDSPATFTCALLNGSAISVGLIAALVGFAGLSGAFLPEAAAMFLAVSLVAIAVAPPFVFSPQWDIVMVFDPPDEPGPPQNSAAAKALVIGPAGLGVATAVVGLLLRLAGSFELLTRTTYLMLAVVALIYVASMVLASIAVASWSKTTRLSVKQTWMLAATQSIIVVAMVALAPA